MAQSSNYIGGQWISTASQGAFQDINPALVEEVVGTFPLSGPEEVDAAVAAAKATLPIWSETPAPHRGEILRKVGDLLTQYKEALARLMTQEMGKILLESRADVQEAIDTAYYFAGEGRRLFGQTTPSELRDKMCFTLREPVGVCAIISPWNFPLAIPAWKIFPALVCGNTMVFKPASDTPACATRLVEILEEAGLPKGVVNLVHGTAESVGDALIGHPDINLVSFTGSSASGRVIAEKCGKLLKRVSLEMGGKNAQIVLDDAQMEQAIEGALWGAFGTTGQRCTATSRLIVQKGIVNEFTQELIQKTQALKVGNGLEEGVQVGPLINEVQRNHVDQYVRIGGGGKDQGKLLIGGGFYQSGECYKGIFYQPTIFGDIRPDATIAQEEIFGPVTAIIPVENIDEAIHVINQSRYGLSSSIYTRNIDLAFQALRKIQAGITYINGPTIGAEVHLPFGGVKESGNGHREAGQTALDIFTEWKTVFIDYSGKLQRAQIDVG